MTRKVKGTQTIFMSGIAEISRSKKKLNTEIDKTLTRHHRLEIRISTDLHSMLRHAAELQGLTMTDFVVAAVQDAAQRAIGAIEQAEIIRPSRSAQECFARALLSPPHPAAALKRAFVRRGKPLRAE